MIETAQGQSIETASWVAVVVAVVGFLGLIVSNWRGWKQTAQEGRDGDFARLRKEIDSYKTDIDELRRECRSTHDEAAKAVAAANAVQLQLVTIQAAFHLVAGELARNDPDNKVLKQARDLVAQAALSDDQIFTAGLDRLVRR